MSLRSVEVLGVKRLGKPAQTTEITPKQTKIDFSEMLERVKNAGGDAHTELTQLKDKFISGKSFSNQELIYYQIRAGEFGMKVELFSKLAESLSSTLKKFQQGAQ